MQIPRPQLRGMIGHNSSVRLELVAMPEPGGPHGSERMALFTTRKNAGLLAKV